VKGKIKLPSAHPEIGAYLAIGTERVRCIGRLHFLVKSQSEDGWHCVDLEPVDDGWPYGCTCRGFTVRKECRHVRLVAHILGLDRV
jgi:hypothetical protein